MVFTFNYDEDLEEIKEIARKLGISNQREILSSPRSSGDLIDIMTHEAVHAIVSLNGGNLNGEGNIPVWLRGGFAIYIGGKNRNLSYLSV